MIYSMADCSVYSFISGKKSDSEFGLSLSYLYRPDFIKNHDKIGVVY